MTFHLQEIPAGMDEKSSPGTLGRELQLLLPLWHSYHAK